MPAVSCINTLLLALTTLAPISRKSWCSTNLQRAGAGAGGASIDSSGFRAGRPFTTTDMSSSSRPWNRTYSAPRSFCTCVSSRCQSARMAVAAWDEPKQRVTCHAGQELPVSGWTTGCQMGMVASEHRTERSFAV